MDYELSADIEHWGAGVSEAIANRAAIIGRNDIEKVFPDANVKIVYGDAHNDMESGRVRAIFDFVQDQWVKWLAQADAEQE